MAEELKESTSLKNFIFVIAKDSLNTYFSNNPDRTTCKYVLSYITSELKRKCHTTAKIYESLMKAVGNDALAQTYIEALITGGASIIGHGTFNDEEKDLIFLAGYLAFLNKDKCIVIITDDNTKLKANFPKNHSDILAELGKLGLESMTYEIYNPNELKTVIDYADKSFAQKYKELE